MRFVKALFLLCGLLGGGNAFAKCTDSTFINPVTDVAWDCIFPISIMGVPVDFGEHPPDSDNGSMLCSCPGKGIVGEGFMVGFWEPARMIDTTQDPWCFPSLGMNLNGGSNSFGYTGPGTFRTDSLSDTMFGHYHYYIFPVWAVLNMFTDIPCISDEVNFDLAMVSEVRPDWGDDLTAMQLYPETALMASPITVLACVADALASAFQRPIDALYWCMGAWGTTYPMSGNLQAVDFAEGNAALTGKAMYVQARTGLLPDRAVNYCSTVSMPIWIKSHWRIQQTDPVPEARCHNIGYPGLLWTAHNNPIGKQDNFSHMIFRKVSCCVVVF